MYKGGVDMNADTLWNLFLETGSPEVYLLFRRAVGSAAQDKAQTSA